MYYQTAWCGNYIIFFLNSQKNACSYFFSFTCGMAACDCDERPDSQLKMSNYKWSQDPCGLEEPWRIYYVLQWPNRWRWRSVLCFSHTNNWAKIARISQTFELKILNSFLFSLTHSQVYMRSATASTDCRSQNSQSVFPMSTSKMEATTHALIMTVAQ